MKSRGLKLFVFFGTLSLMAAFCFFSVPKVAHAGLYESVGNITSVSCVLSKSFATCMPSSPAADIASATSASDAVSKVWNVLMTAVNSLIILLLVVIAFCEILRININTYGFKKMMPTLILAVIAANFSFILCRLMIDMAGVAATFFGSTGGNQLQKAFLPTWSWSGFWGSLLMVLIGLAVALLFYAVAFLMIIRNWVVYFLVAVAPLGMMAMVLPQTKTMFNQWIQNLFRWIFMPVVSLALVWLGAQFTDFVSVGSGVMGTVFVGACLYFALTLPFKMGGPIAAAWGNLAKKTWAKTGGAAGKWAYGATVGAAGKHVKAIAGDYASGLWDATKTKIFDNKTLKAMGIKPLRMGIRAKQYAERSRENMSAREERMKGELYGPEGLGRNAKTRAKEVIRRKINEGMKGEDVENFKNDIFNRFIDEGKNAKEGTLEFKSFQDWRKLWEGSGMAKFRMATADVSQKAEESRAFKMAVLGGTDQAITDRDARDVEKQAWQKRISNKLGWNEDKIKDFIEFYGEERKNAQVYEAFQGKAEKDALFRPAKESERVHAITQLKNITDELKKIENDLEPGLRDSFHEVLKGNKKLDDLIKGKSPDEQSKIRKQFNRYNGLRSRTEGLLKNNNVMLWGEELLTIDDDRKKEIFQKVANNHRNMITRIQKEVTKKGGVAPRAIARQVRINNQGIVEGLNELDNVEYTRLLGIISEKTSARQKVYSDLAGQEQNAIAYNGAHTHDRMSMVTALAHNDGDILENPTDSLGNELDLQTAFNLEDRYTANAGSRKMTLKDAVQGPNIAQEEFTSLSRNLNKAKVTAKYWLRDDRVAFKPVYDRLFDSNGEKKQGITDDQIEKEFTTHYFSKSSTTLRNKLNAGIAAQMPN